MNDRPSKRNQQAMTPQRWQQIKQLLTEALELEPQRRAAWLDQACAGDDELRREVESLLAEQLGAAEFIEAPAFAGVALTTNAPTMPPLDDRASFDPFAPEQRIGPYRIVRELARGGMGAVYLAQRADAYRQQVALKLIRRGLDTDFVLRRFQQERQILAGLDHPNIARLLDGGTTPDGAPYLVMEYIEGQPIDQYCDAHKLTTVERLKLFRQVCAAVHYAHQRLVIHRDIKPSNILVTANGTPKLLDFGIAKLLAPDLSGDTIDPTAPAQRLMTPAYASPEQVRGEPITTASDVYSLGVLLYELLTGHRPYQITSNQPHELLRAVCESEPPRPSTAITRIEQTRPTDGQSPISITPESVSKTRDGEPDKLRRKLKGDVDNIVLMALRKEPQRRYASVEQFSEDIRRHLNGLLVIARQDTFSYRTSKFARRNKLALSAAALILLTLIGGIVMTARARARAERRFNDVRQLAHAVLFDYHDAIAELRGSTPVRQRLVKDALTYLDSLAAEAKGDAALQRELAAAYRKIGDVQGNPYYGNLGNTPGAIDSYRKSLAIREALAARSRTPEALREVADSLNGLGDVLWEADDLKGAHESYRRAVEILEPLAAATPTDLKLRRELARAYAQVGDIKGHPYFPNLGDTAGGLEAHRQALALRQSLIAAEPNNADFRRALYQSYYSMGYMLRGTGDLRGAEQNLRQALELSRALAAAEPNNARAKRNLDIHLQMLGDVLRDQGRLPEALAAYRESQAIDEATLAADPTSAQARRDVGITYNRLAKLLMRMNDFPGAIAMSRKALALDEAAYTANPTNSTARHDVAMSYDTHGDVLLRAGDAAGALANFRKALAIREEYLRGHAGDTTTLPGLMDSYERIGDVQAKAGDAAAATASYHKAREVGEKFLSLDPQRDRIRDSLATVCYKLGKQTALVAARTAPAQQASHWREAQSAYQRSLEFYTALRQRGGLQAEDASKPDEIARELARCDAALAKLR